MTTKVQFDGCTYYLPSESPTCPECKEPVVNSNFGAFHRAKKGVVENTPTCIYHTQCIRKILGGYYNYNSTNPYQCRRSGCQVTITEDNTYFHVPSNCVQVLEISGLKVNFKADEKMPITETGRENVRIKKRRCCRIAIIVSVLAVALVATIVIVHLKKS